MTNPFADIANICFTDFETKALPGSDPNDSNLKTAGTYRYRKNAFGILQTFAVGDGPVTALEVRDFANGALMWKDVPDAVKRHHDRVMGGKAWYCAFNAGFDRNVWNECTYDYPRIEPRHMIDMMAQATVSNLAPSLEGMSKNLGRGGKQADGKYLISLFCGHGPATPQTHPAEWARFVTYGIGDVVEMREGFRCTRALTPDEWEDYFVSERINERGMAIDLAFVERAARIAAYNATVTNEELIRWTNGQITSVTQVQRIAEWVYDRLEDAEARTLLVTEYDEDARVDEDSDDLKVVKKLSLKKDRIEAVLAFFRARESRDGALGGQDKLIVDVLEARLYGGSSSPAKFSKMMEQHDEGFLRGQYVFNGAQQTGRFSSKSVQVQNITRSSLGQHEIAAIEMIGSLDI